MTFWQKTERKIQSFEVSSWVSWLSMFIKVTICKILERLNLLFYKRPNWERHQFEEDAVKYFNSTKSLANLYEKEFKFDKKGNFIYAINEDDTENIGDQTLMNSIYSVYDSTFGKGEYFNNFYVKNQLEKIGDKMVLFRGRNLESCRDDPSGDQLIGILWAYSESKTRRLNLEMEKFLEQLLEDKVLWDTEGKVSSLGNFKPNLITINGDCVIWLVACVVAGRIDLFLKYYFDYGYGKMIPYSSVYLFDDRYKIGRRNWFSCNIAIIALCILWRELDKHFFGFWKTDKEFVRELHIIQNIENSVLKILNSNKHNLFFWLLAIHYGVIDKRSAKKMKAVELVPKEALAYFETFRITQGIEVMTPTSYEILPPEGYEGTLMPLGLYKSSWVWEREPYKILLENKWVSHLDLVFVQRLKEMHQVIKGGDKPWYKENF